jgi:CubicO group peptidase (beta-lactamase class C family)
MPRPPLWPLLLAAAGCTAPPPPAPPPPPIPPSAPSAPKPAPLAAWHPGRLPAERKAAITALTPELDKLFTADHASHKYPGAGVGIVIDGELVYAKGFGYRDVERKLPFDADTVFPIASVTKGFTAMAVLKLRDEGKLDLDAPAERYYAPLAKLAYPTRDAPKITVRHLLMHSAGLPEDNPWADVNDSLGEAELARMIEAGLSFSRAPDTHFEYANIGYAVLGRVIQGASGVSMREYVRREILTPLGMTASGWEASEMPPGSVAVGYRGQEGSHDRSAPAVIAPIHPLGAMDSAGGLFTTVRDLARYVAFQLDAWPPRDAPEAGPLRRSSVREMQMGARKLDWLEVTGVLTQRRPPPQAGLDGDRVWLNTMAYGFGLIASTTCEDGFHVWHSGGLPGYVTALAMYPERGLGVVMFINDERFGMRVIDDAVRVLRRAGLVPIRKAEPAPALVRTRAGVIDLLARWDDAKAQALFEPTFFRYASKETFAGRFAQLAKDHGACRAEGDLAAVNRLRGTFRAVCERGSITFAAALSPEAAPRLQALEWREDMPPGPALEGAAAKVLHLVERWDAKAAARVLAPAADVAQIRKALARVALDHGRCKIERAVESDGKASATFLISCAEGGPFELSLRLDEKTGRVLHAESASPVSEDRPNCAD